MTKTRSYHFHQFEDSYINEWLNVANTGILSLAERKIRVHSV